MKKLLFALATLVFAVASAAEPALFLVLPDAYGDYFLLSDHVGEAAGDPKPVIIDFFTTWCEPCKKEIAALKELKRRYGGRIVVRFVNIEGFDKKGKVLEFARKLGIEELALFDHYREYARMWGVVVKDKGGEVARLPACFVIGKDGKIKAKHIGFPKELKQSLVKVIEAELKRGRR